MKPWQRLELLYGSQVVQKIKEQHVLIAGLGGVGSYSAEALARAFVGKLTLIDFDRYDITNLNRQLYATHHTVGQLKVDVVKEGLLAINPDLHISTFSDKVSTETLPLFFKNPINYVVDAIDDIEGKVALIAYCHQHHIPIISAMGTGFRKNPQGFRIIDIYETSYCPLAKKLRKALKDKGISYHPVVFSTETPSKRIPGESIGSNSFVPASAGLLLASYVIDHIEKGK